MSSTLQKTAERRHEKFNVLLPRKRSTQKLKTIIEKYFFRLTKKDRALKMKSFGSLRLQPYDESEIKKCFDVENRYLCIFCIEICYSIEKLKLHYTNVHGHQPVESETKPGKTCSICNMNFKSLKTLSKHVKSVHYKLKSFICSVCSKQFSRKTTLDVSQGRLQWTRPYNQSHFRST